MESTIKATLRSSLQKLAIAGQQAGFTTEQMIQLLDAGLSVETLLDVISWRLNHPVPLARVPCSSEWIV